MIRPQTNFPEPLDLPVTKLDDIRIFSATREPEKLLVIAAFDSGPIVWQMQGWELRQLAIRLYLAARKVEDAADEPTPGGPAPKVN